MLQSLSVCSLFHIKLLTYPRIQKGVFQIFQQLMNKQLQCDLLICEWALCQNKGNI